MRMRPSRVFVRVAVLLPCALRVVSAQGTVLGFNNVGLGVGDVPKMGGIRINYRDLALEEVHGVNITVFKAHSDAKQSYVQGAAIGVPFTSATRFDGLVVGLLGFTADRHLRGIGIAPVGIGSGGSMDGLLIGGIGLGGGGNLSGVGVGGLGIGMGGNVKGLMIGGLGVAGSGSAHGIIIGGLGVGMGGDIRGFSFGAVGVGSGTSIDGIAIGGIGVGAPVVHGLMVSGIAGGAHDVHGAAVTGVWFRIDKGELRGFSAAGYNQVNGTQHGLTIGIVNLAQELHGAQIGLVNIAYNNSKWRKVLPLFNWH
jgi:hypothetical protein